MVATAISPNETTVGKMLGRISRTEDAPVAGPQRLGGHDEVPGGVRQGRGPDHPEDERRAEDADDQGDLPELWPQNVTMAMTATMAGKASST